VSTKDHQISIRFEPETVERAALLVRRLRATKEFCVFGLSRAAVLRVALVEGLRVLEQRYGLTAQEPTK